MAFKIAAGSRVRDVYEAASRRSAIVVAGSAQDVGIVGWFTGGGHGPLSQTYGMGIDNVLRVAVVTPAGDLIVANECLHPDLFWAIVVGLVARLVSYRYCDENIPIANNGNALIFNLPLHPENDTDFWDADAIFYSKLPRLKEGGLGGYLSLISPSIAIRDLPVLYGSLSIFNKPNGTAASLWEPLNQKLSPEATSLNYTTEVTAYSSFFKSWNSTVGYEPVGWSEGILASRLLPDQAWTADPKHLASVFRNLTTQSIGVQTYAVANSANAHLNVSLNPAWGSAVIHTIVTSGFYDHATLKEQRNAGAYINKGDPNDPNFQWTFFGANYERLQSTKRRYDPKGVLWCEACVGGEDWVPETRYSQDTVKVEYAELNGHGVEG